MRRFAGAVVGITAFVFPMLLFFLLFWFCAFQPFFSNLPSQYHTVIDRDLRDLDSSQRNTLRRAIEAHVRKSGGGKHRSRFELWHIWTFEKKGEQPLFVLLEVDNLSPHPGTTYLHLTDLDGDGSVLRETEFTTGYRCYLKGAKLMGMGDDAFPLIDLQLNGTLGPGYTEAYIARIGNRYDLVRLENAQGNATRNSFDVNHQLQLGPEIALQTEAQWEADLCSGDRPKILRALTWLTGRQDIAAREKVRNRLQELAQGPDSWMREAAGLVLGPEVKK